MTKIYIIILINLLLITCQFGLTSRYSTTGAQITKLYNQLYELKNTNSRLSKQVYELSSLTHIQSEAITTILTPLRVDFLAPPEVASKR